MALGILACVGAISLLVWIGILLHPARPWDFQVVGEDIAAPPEPTIWPTVCALVPARNESLSLPQTLPALLKQDYPGELFVIIVDDRSKDGTAETAYQVAAEAGGVDRLTVISGADLPEGWVGKVWALEQGAAACGLQSRQKRYVHSFRRSLTMPMPQYFLLTDADIRHTPGSLRRLVAESESNRLALNSRMARLRCRSGAERLLIPPFVFFFNLLYPLRQVNDQQSAVAAAAGGCVLLAWSALERVGGFSCIKDKIIDDVSLAQQIKSLKEPIHLALSRTTVESIRVYDSLAAIWTMVRRTAFTELRHSWIRLVGTLLGLVLLFLIPPLWVAGGGGIALANIEGWLQVPSFWAFVLVAQGICVWALMAFVYRRAVHFFGLSGVWSWTLPLAGMLYGAMTVDSAFRYVTGQRSGWRDR